MVEKMIWSPRLVTSRPANISRIGGIGAVIVVNSSVKERANPTKNQRERHNVGSKASEKRTPSKAITQIARKHRFRGKDGFDWRVLFLSEKRGLEKRDRKARAMKKPSKTEQGR